MTATSKATPLTPQDLEDLLTGSALLGAGGGGPKSVGREIIDGLARQGKRPSLIAPAALVDGDLGAVAAFVGAPTAASGDGFDWSPATLAFQALDNQLAPTHHGKRLAYVLPGEVGAGNSFIPIAVAASLPTPLPVVDCAGARRAIPDLAEVTYASHQVPISPIMLADTTKTMGLLVGDPILAGNVLHGVIGAQGFGQLAGVAMWAMDGATVKQAAIGGTTSYAIALGRVIREARAAHKPAWEAARAFLHGRLLFHGVVEGVNEDTTGGFDIGQVTIRAADGELLRIYNENENLIAWSSKRAQPVAMAPDLICFITADGAPFSNADPEMTKGTEVYVLGQASTPQLRAPYIVAQFLSTLRTMGYGGPYMPLEELH